MKKPSKEMIELLVATSNNDPEIALKAQYKLVKALETPLKKGIMMGDILDGVYESTFFAPGTSVEYPLDFLTPSTVKDFRAYLIPGHGRIPERAVEGDYVMVPTFRIGSSIDWNLRYARDARWDIVSRAMEVMEATIVRKTNDDGWQTIISAGKDRNIMTTDSAAAQGKFTKELIATMKVKMAREGGGNATSINKYRLTDMWVSPEAIQDVRAWTSTDVDDFTRRAIFVAEDGSINGIYGVNLHEMYELGTNQEYQLYFTNAVAAGGLGGTLGASDDELVIGLDLSRNDSFVNPVREELSIFPDPALHRQQREGWYCWKEHGFSVLHNLNVLLGSF